MPFNNNKITFNNIDFVTIHEDYDALDSDYQFQGISGEGAYGKVYKAFHNETKLFRALK